MYPKSQYSYNVGAGRDGDELVCYLSVKLYPIRYESSKNTLYYTNDVIIKINYEPPDPSLILADEYELVVIAPSRFSRALQPLIEHKNNYGVTSILVTLDEIYNGEHFPVEGRDCAGEIKIVNTEIQMTTT